MRVRACGRERVGGLKGGWQWRESQQERGREKFGERGGGREKEGERARARERERERERESGSLRPERVSGQ